MISELIRSSTSRAFTGSSSLTKTSTEAGSSPEPLSWACSLSRKSSGMISAARTSPSATLSSASSRLLTATHSMRSQSWSNAASWENPPSPSSSPPFSAAISLKKATRGLSGPRETAKPISTARTIG